MKFSKTATAALVTVALCFSSTSASAAAACQGEPGSAGCVLPVGEAPPVQTPPPAPPAAAAAPEVVQGGGISLGLILLGVAALAALAYLLLKGGDGDDEPVSP